ncbi:Substrate-binding region of ABC-type glycine betaine transport system [Methanohalobium evestigatum Z-7303]|uniref:Substrate-binding region of ABC-type glycine betaine transport system n=1 Tax=Methanohalobium evestigatum (strain ATCC BAA-1072 / DSM 3721 / NBRC 107634 / OCM 161 / Z-7303) TaxID=644295 RepID=D7EAQ5_METEZ|nr:glycine betaine ABC transporter substrate-binding protein [Methanohalobium evestigatum]ADI75054.1 Substrate-binding region of ABC-type glycine betaine transport system [Methanohalobium evestigatum Z-7303]
MKWKVIAMVLMLITAIMVSGCAQNPQTNESNSNPNSDETIVIGSKLFQESYILAHMLSILLEDNGYNTEVEQGLGGTFVNYEALKQGQIDAYVEYSGTAYSQILKKPSPDTWDPQMIYEETKKGLMQEDNVKIANRLGFENAYAIAVDENWAEEHNITKLSQLEGYASNMVIGTDPEFATREDGLPRIKEVYGFEFKDYKQGAPSIMYQSIKNDEVDAISAYTTDTKNEKFGLRVLEDDKGALPPYDAITLMTSDFASSHPDVMDTLGQLNNTIDQETMRNLNYQYDVENKEAKDIARQFLENRGLIEENN